MITLDFTGERLVPSVFGKVSIEHLHRYAVALEFSKGKKVLDIACGEGYGSNLLAESAESVIGVDISPEAVNHARIKYLKNNLEFHEGSVLEIPIVSNFFDLVVSFETIEHITDHSKMISEIKRVLKPDGVLLVSTPEKLADSDKNKFNNPFHEKELFESEFIDLISGNFKYYEIGFQKFLSGSFIRFESESQNDLQIFKGDFSNIVKDNYLGKEFLVSISSDFPLNLSFNTSFFKIGKWEEYLIKEQVDHQISKIKNSFRYKLGNLLFYPYQSLKNFLR